MPSALIPSKLSYPAMLLAEQLVQMCIRDRSRIDTSPVTGEPVPVKAGYGDEVVSGCVNTSGPVSYTHLDVYKRQVCKYCKC